MSFPELHKLSPPQFLSFVGILLPQSHSLAFSVTFLFTLIFIHEFVFHFVSYAYYGNEQSTWGKKLSNLKRAACKKHMREVSK